MGLSGKSSVLVKCRSNLVITMIPYGLKKSVNVSQPGLWILKKTPGFCWNGAFETCFLSTGKFLIFRSILHVEEPWLLWTGNLNFCSKSLFFRATPGNKDRLILVWMSCFWNSAEFQDLHLEWPGRSQVPAIISCSLSLLLSATVLVLTIAEAARPGRGRWALSPKDLLVSTSRCIRVMTISTLHSGS